MALTGVPLILVAAAATLAGVAALVRSWPRGNRWRRLPTRALSLLLSEALLVLTAGLVYNRHEQFYPSWTALAGRTSTSAGTAPASTGRLDGSFALDPDQPWQPPGSAAWHLAGPATVTVPTAYRKDPRTFPVLLALGGHPPAAGVVEVSLTPGPRTGSLPGLPARLATDLRVTTHGWVLVTAAGRAALARHLVTDFPGRFSALAVVGHAAAGGPSPVPERVFPTWTAATGWAVAQSPPALVPAHVLPRVAPS